MATVLSAERTNDAAVPSVLNPANKAGRVYQKYFSFNTTTITVNNGDTVELVKVPVGARIVGGYITFGAMGASATASIGYAGATTRYLNGGSVAAIGQLSLANTQALNFGDELAAEKLIILTAGGANYAAAKDLTGYIEYISAGE